MAAVWPDVTVEENNLTQQISILRKTFSPEASADGWIQTVPRRGYRFTAPLAESSPQAPARFVEEAEHSGDAPFAQAPLRSRERWHVRFFMALATIAAVFALAGMLTSFGGSRDHIGSIAVLPLQPLTPDDNLSAVGLGVADAVVQRLSYARDLRVRPLASTRAHPGRNGDPATIGRELGVDAVLTGTIQRDRNRYRVTMELIDVRSRAAIWSGKIEESVADVFRLQDLVAEATLRSIQRRLTDAAAASLGAPRRDTPIPAAHEAYLKGRYYWSRRTGGDVERSIEEFEKAVALDGSYAAAWAGLASSVNLQSLHFIAEPEASFARSRSAARQALLFDPDLAEAHAALGFISLYHDWKWAEAERSLRRAIELDPANGNYRQLLSNLLLATGRIEESIEQIEAAIAADPASVMVRAVAGRQYYVARDYRRSASVLRKTIAMDNTFAAPHYSLGVTLMQTGDYAGAERELQEALRRGFGPQGLATLAALAAIRNDRARAHAFLDQARETAKNGAMLHFDFALAYVALGDTNAALQELDLAIERRYSGVVWIGVDPRFDPIRNDPRFQERIARVGFPKPR